jgi:hypothetical protein
VSSSQTVLSQCSSWNRLNLISVGSPERWQLLTALDNRSGNFLKQIDSDVARDDGARAIMHLCSPGIERMALRHWVGTSVSRGRETASKPRRRSTRTALLRRHTASPVHLPTPSCSTDLPHESPLPQCQRITCNCGIRICKHVFDFAAKSVRKHHLLVARQCAVSQRSQGCTQPRDRPSAPRPTSPSPPTAIGRHPPR